MGILMALPEIIIEVAAAAAEVAAEAAAAAAEVAAEAAIVITNQVLPCLTISDYQY